MLKLSDYEKDVLMEVISIGIGNASKALADMINSKIYIKILTFDARSVKKIQEELSKNRDLSAGIFVRITGNINGVLFFITSRKNALILSDILQKKKLGTTKMLGMMDRSALEELTSILAAKFLTSLNKFLGINAIHTAPSTVFNFGDSILNFVLMSSEKKFESGLICKIVFGRDKDEVDGEFIIILDAQSTKTLLDRIKNKEGFSKGKVKL